MPLILSWTIHPSQPPALAGHFELRTVAPICSGRKDRVAQSKQGDGSLLLPFTLFSIIAMAVLSEGLEWLEEIERGMDGVVDSNG